jgi:Flp pilus assembly protein TadG
MCQSLIRQKDEGQSTVIVVLAMGIFLLGAIGLGFDGSHLYSQRQMAQTAADAAAQAGMMSIYNGTNASGTTAFATSAPFTCTTTDAKTPCNYARMDGFGGTASDTVTVWFPPASAAPGVQLSGVDPTNLIEVDVSRSVPTTFMRLLGSTATTVTAKAVAAIVDVVSPIPIVILHPDLKGALSTNGGILIQICGGPGRSVQVNSGDSQAIVVKGTSATVDLSKAGPKDTGGTCTTGTGADFGVWGGPNSPPFTFLSGTKPGRYLPGASVIPDPLLSVPAPDTTNFPSQDATDPTKSPILAAGATGTVGTPAAGITCPSSAGSHGCTVLSPGLYAAGPALKNTTALFKPGIYDIQTGGFACVANCNAIMAPGATADPATPTGTGTGWDGTPSGGGILVYNSGTGTFNIGSNGNVSLIGAPFTCTSPCTDYEGILFFEDRTAAANTGSGAHSLGGGGSMILRGTIYLTNSPAAGSTHYQEVDLQGTPGNNTQIQGEIIVDALGMGGNGTISMNLNSLPAYTLREVALVQ